MEKKLLLSIWAFTLLALATEAQTNLANNNTTIEDNKVNYLYSYPGNISKRKIPSTVKEAFNENFKHVKKVKWRIEEKDVFAADFINEKKENVSVYLNNSGNVIAISTLKNIKNIHFSLLDRINSQLNFPVITDIVEVKDYVSQEVFYVVSILVNNEIVEHHLDINGNILNEKQEAEYDGTIKI